MVREQGRRRPDLFETLAADYPLLFLEPDRDDQDSYRKVVLRGAVPQKSSLSHYRGDAHDRLETADTPAGPVRVATLGNRRDFELLVRGFLAAKDGPLATVPESQGAATLTVFNWPRIRARLAGCPPEDRAAEFRRFTSIKENYLDYLILLSRGPYSNVSAEEAGFGREEWLELSDTIRRYHELTHFICRRLYPDDIDTIRDELVADAVGLYAALGRFDPELEKRFLGIAGDRHDGARHADGRDDGARHVDARYVGGRHDGARHDGNRHADACYVGGRLGNYTNKPDRQVGLILDELERIRMCIDNQSGADPFSLIPVLMQKI